MGVPGINNKISREKFPPFLSLIVYSTYFEIGRFYQDSVLEVPESVSTNADSIWKIIRILTGMDFKLI